jgi:molybdenum cofactor cytidylyltransferase
MRRAPSFCAVILADQPTPSQGTPVPRQEYLAAAIAALNRFADMVIVVAGENRAALAPTVYANGGELAQNPTPDRRPFSFLQVGLQEVLNRGRDAAMVTMLTLPPVNSGTLEALLRTFAIAASEEKWAVIPEYQGQPGHPILVGREMIEACLRAPSTESAQDVLTRNKERIQYMAVDDSSILNRASIPEVNVSPA